MFSIACEIHTKVNKSSRANKFPSNFLQKKTLFLLFFPRPLSLKLTGCCCFAAIAAMHPPTHPPRVARWKKGYKVALSFKGVFHWVKNKRWVYDGLFQTFPILPPFHPIPVAYTDKKHCLLARDQEKKLWRQRKPKISLLFLVHCIENEKRKIFLAKKNREGKKNWEPLLSPTIATSVETNWYFLPCQAAHKLSLCRGFKFWAC